MTDPGSTQHLDEPDVDTQIDLLVIPFDAATADVPEEDHDDGPIQVSWQVTRDPRTAEWSFYKDGYSPVDFRISWTGRCASPGVGKIVAARAETCCSPFRPDALVWSLVMGAQFRGVPVDLVLFVVPSSPRISLRRRALA